jgi:hypothetical protein
MQLQLHANGEAITQYPSCQGFRREGIMHGRKQDGTNLIQPVGMQCLNCPQVVGFIAQHKLDLVMRSQVIEIGPSVFFGLARPGRLYVENF